MSFRAIATRTAATAAFVLPAAFAAAQTVTVHDAWVREPMGGRNVTGAFAVPIWSPIWIARCDCESWQRRRRFRRFIFIEFFRHSRARHRATLPKTCGSIGRCCSWR